VETKATGKNSSTIMTRRRKRRNWYRARALKCSETCRLLTRLRPRRMRRMSLPMRSRLRIEGMSKMILPVAKRDKEKKRMKMRTMMMPCLRKTPKEKLL